MLKIMIIINLKIYILLNPVSFFHECFQGPNVNFFVNVIKYGCPDVDL